MRERHEASPTRGAHSDRALHAQAALGRRPGTPPAPRCAADRPQDVAGTPCGARPRGSDERHAGAAGLGRSSGAHPPPPCVTWARATLRRRASVGALPGLGRARGVVPARSCRCAVGCGSAAVRRLTRESDLAVWRSERIVRLLRSSTRLTERHGYSHSLVCCAGTSGHDLAPLPALQRGTAVRCFGGWSCPVPHYFSTTATCW